MRKTSEKKAATKRIKVIIIIKIALISKFFIISPYQLKTISRL
ncbi:MAG: hypothetical protein ACJAXN_002599 [Psychromonas sp.]|jgi:hypothetical protein